MFPLSVEGLVKARDDGSIDVDAVKERLCATLRDQRITVNIEGNEVRFVNWAFSVWPLWRYSLADSGHFAVHSTHIGYRLSTKALLVVTLVIVGVAALIFLPGDNPMPVRLGILFGVWIYFFVSNYALLCLRNRRFLQKVASLGPTQQ